MHAPLTAMTTQRLTFLALVFAALASVTSCESSDKPKKPAPVPPPSDISGLPWSRPQPWEAGAGFGGMMPQSH
jgi:hypothetical protein